MNVPTALTNELNEHLDILGRQPLLSKLYTQICLCYAVHDDSEPVRSSIMDTLNNGLERLSTSFPWMAGQVVDEGPSEDRANNFRIKPFERIPRLTRNDLDVPTMETLRQNNFPSRLLDEEIICPRNTFPGGHVSDPAPVFLVQANFVKGGLLLSFVAQHNTMDMTGQGQMIDLLSKASHNQPFSQDELVSGNLSRENLLPLVKGNPLDQETDLLHQTLPVAVETDDPSASPLPPPQCSWAYFVFSPSSLAALKTLATKSILSGFISTDDALSAFIWQSVTRARLPRLDPTNDKTTFARAIDARRYLDVSPTYPGMIQNMTYSTSLIRESADSSLGPVASQLREALSSNTSDLGSNTRALMAAIDRDPSKYSFTATIDLSKDIMFSSWSKLDCYDLDFNLGLGKPEAVRRPQFPPCESLMYAMPKALGGEIAVAMCLRDEDMDRLRADKEFTKYGTYIG